MQRYLSKISGPLLDRIDIHIEVTPVPWKIIRWSKAKECWYSEVVLQENQTVRFEQMDHIHYNAQMNTKHWEYCALDDVSNNYWKRNGTIESYRQGYDRILKVARTIADLDAAQ
jgi:magnesium chelatase family protein